jgi:hypothetical protein
MGVIVLPPNSFDIQLSITAHASLGGNAASRQLSENIWKFAHA